MAGMFQFNIVFGILVAFLSNAVIGLLVLALAYRTKTELIEGGGGVLRLALVLLVSLGPVRDCVAAGVNGICLSLGCDAGGCRRLRLGV